MSGSIEILKKHVEQIKKEILDLDILIETRQLSIKNMNKEKNELLKKVALVEDDIKKLEKQ